DGDVALGLAAHERHQREVVVARQVLDQIPGLDLRTAVGRIGQHLREQQDRHLSERSYATRGSRPTAAGSSLARRPSSVVTRAAMKTWKHVAVAAAGAVLGFIFFATYEGMRQVDPREYDWVMNGKDIRIEYSGWQAFRLEPWQWPPGRINSLVFPVGTSI